MKGCCHDLFNDVALKIRETAPNLASALDTRGWVLPLTVDRVSALPWPQKS